MEKDNNPNNLEIGKHYWVRYTPCNSNWEKVLISRFTQFGHAWMDGQGIISQDLYDIMECTPEKELEEKARTFLLKKGYKGFALESPMAKCMAEFFNEVSPNFKQEIIRSTYVSSKK